MASIKVYGVPPSTFTRAVLMGCQEKGIDYELVPTFPSTVGPLIRSARSRR
jgi:glutathione S-transferase